jgi:membrane AbrB-like protein
VGSVFGLWLRGILALVFGTAGGAVFYFLHLPLPWMLGSLLFCGLAAALQTPIALPRRIRAPMTGVLGAMIGAYFLPDSGAQPHKIALVLTGVLVFVSVAGGLGYLYFRLIGRMDHPTAFFSAMPGGVVEMVVLGAERGGDERVISLIHGARIFMVVLTLPFLLDALSPADIGRGTGSWLPLSSMSGANAAWLVATVVIGMALGKLLRLPAGLLLGPLLISLALHGTGLSDFKLPSLLLAGAQVVLGATIGCRFAGVKRAELAYIFRLSIGSNILLLLLALFLSWPFSLLGGDQFETFALAYSPGGLAEMSLIALSLDVDVALIVVAHLFRVLLVVAGSTALFGLIPRRRGPD